MYCIALNYMRIYYFAAADDSDIGNGDGDNDKRWLWWWCGDDDTDVWGGAGNDDSNGGYDSVYTVVGGDEFVYNYSC